MDLPVGTRVLIRAVVIGTPTLGVNSHVSCRGQLSGHTMNDIVLSDIVTVDTPIADDTPAPPVAPNLSFNIPFTFNDRVRIDETDVIGRVVQLSLRRDGVIFAEVSWLAGGQHHDAWFDIERLSAAP